MKKKLRPLGQITDDLEPLLQEMANDHELQMGEILALVLCYMEIHLPDSRENYVDGTKPVYFYGHISEFDKIKE